MIQAKRLLIVGGGGFGREVLQWLSDIPENGVDWRVGGFLDANPNCLNGYSVGLQVVGDPDGYEPGPNDLFVCALGMPDVKRKVVTRLLGKGGKFITLIHPTAIVGGRTVVGEGCVLCPSVVVTTDVEIGRFVMLNLAATVGHDVRVGDWSTLSGHVDITGGAELGEGVFAGSHACVMPKVTVGDNAVVGAGSVAVRRVRAGATVFGVPAKELCFRTTGREKPNGR